MKDLSTCTFGIWGWIIAAIISRIIWAETEFFLFALGMSTFWAGIKEIVISNRKGGV